MTRPAHTDRAAANARRLRREGTISEDRLWSAIRKGATGARFRRQVPIGRWIADFASLDPRIVVEVDGPSHDLRDESERTAFLESEGFVVLRFGNDQIRRHLADVAEQISLIVRDVSE